MLCSKLVEEVDAAAVVAAVAAAVAAAVVAVVVRLSRGRRLQ